MVKALLGAVLNPITRAHLLCAKATRDFTGSDVIIVPSFAPWHKAGHNDMASFADRLEMTKLGCAGEPGLVISDIESRLPAPSFTMQTLRSLIPGFEQTTEPIYLYLGSDQIRKLPGWKEVETLVKRVKFLSFPRWQDVIPTEIEVGGRKIKLDIQELSNLPGLIAKENWPTPFNTIQSTLVRDRAKRGEPILDLVPNAAVAEYIRDKKLYLTADQVRVVDAVA